ncbi:hypothetical protein WAI453_006178 [Rhynchosporium graminicola]
MVYQITNRTRASRDRVYHIRFARESSVASTAPTVDITPPSSPAPPDFEKESARWCHGRGEEQTPISSSSIAHGVSTHAKPVPSKYSNHSTERSTSTSEDTVIRRSAKRGVGIKSGCDKRCKCSCHQRAHRLRRAGRRAGPRGHHAESVFPTPPSSPDIGPLLRSLGRQGVKSSNSRKNRPVRVDGGEVGRSFNGQNPRG